MTQLDPSVWQVEVKLDEWPAVLGLIRASSRGELFVCSSPSPPVGTRVQLSLSLPDNSSVSFVGEVVLVNEGSAISDQPTGFVISFTKQQTSDLVLLEAMASANCDVDPDDIDAQQFAIGASVIHQGTAPAVLEANEDEFSEDELSEERPYDDDAATVTCWPPPEPTGGKSR
jgi:hypothetical protein